jgi:hypothetical protein
VNPSAQARIRAMQDIALAAGHDTVTVALYGALVGEYAHRLSVPDAPAPPGETPVTRAARRAASADAQSKMTACVSVNWGSICEAARALDALDALADPFPEVPSAASAYRVAAQEQAEAAGECPAAMAWSGAAAEARYLRLYGELRVDTLDAFEVDPVFAAARRELADGEKARLTDLVVSCWDCIDSRAEELMGVNR